MVYVTATAELFRREPFPSGQVLILARFRPIFAVLVSDRIRSWPVHPGHLGATFCITATEVMVSILPVRCGVNIAFSVPMASAWGGRWRRSPPHGRFTVGGAFAPCVFGITSGKFNGSIAISPQKIAAGTNRVSRIYPHNCGCKECGPIVASASPKSVTWIWGLARRVAETGYGRRSVFRDDTKRAGADGPRRPHPRLTPNAGLRPAGYFESTGVGVTSSTKNVSLRRWFAISEARASAACLQGFGRMVGVAVYRTSSGVRLPRSVFEIF
jgi:hypothetical protein